MHLEGCSKVTEVSVGELAKLNTFENKLVDGPEDFFKGDQNKLDKMNEFRQKYASKIAGKSPLRFDHQAAPSSTSTATAHPT